MMNSFHSISAFLKYCGYHGPNKLCDYTTSPFTRILSLYLSLDLEQTRHLCDI